MDDGTVARLEKRIAFGTVMGDARLRPAVNVIAGKLDDRAIGLARQPEAKSALGGDIRAAASDRSARIARVQVSQAAAPAAHGPVAAAI